MTTAYACVLAHAGGAILGARSRVPGVHVGGCILVRHVAQTTGIVSSLVRLV
jgi:hypothetical protein